MSSRLVCHLIDYGGSTAGSFIPALCALSRALNARGDKLAVIATRIPGATWQDALAADGAEVVWCDDVQGARSALQMLRPRIVHTHFLRYDVVSTSARGARVFWHVHSARDRYTSIARARAFLKYRAFGARVGAVVAVSEAVRRECIAFFAPSARVRVILNAVDTDWFRPPTPTERNAAREALGIDADEKVALFFDRDPLKGGAVVKAAKPRIVRFRLLTAGGVNGRVADTRTLYWAADTLIFASVPTAQSPLAEGSSYVTLEALACGLSVVASDIPVAREICSDLENAFMYPSWNSDALSTALEKAIVHRSSEAGRRHVVGGYSLHRWTSDMLKLYE